MSNFQYIKNAAVALMGVINDMPVEAAAFAVSMALVMPYNGYLTMQQAEPLRQPTKSRYEQVDGLIKERDSLQAVTAQYGESICRLEGERDSLQIRTTQLGDSLSHATRERESLQEVVDKINALVSAKKSN